MRVVSLALVLAACSSSSSTTDATNDGGAGDSAGHPDGNARADSASRADGGSVGDAGHDAPTSPAADAAHDASGNLDALVEGSTDARGDASSLSDASEMGAPDGGSVTCNGTPCYAGQSCVSGACQLTSCVGSHVPGDYATITSAMTALAGAGGGTICVAPGVFEEEAAVQGSGGSGTIIVQGAGRGQTILKSALLDVPFVNYELAGLTVHSVLIQSSGNDSGGVPMTVSLVDTTVDGMGSTNGAAIAANAVGGPLTLTLDGVDLSATGTQPGLVAALGGSFDEEQELTLTVVNSYIHGAATGFSLTGEIYYTATATFENNTFESNGTGVLDSLLDGTGESSTLVFFNNLVVNNMLGISSSDASTFGYNCLYGNTTNYAGSAVSGMGTVESNPLLDTESPPALGPGSPCRAVGDPTHAPSHDFYGRHRSTSIDIGAVQSSP